MMYNNKCREELQNLQKGSDNNEQRQKEKVEKTKRQLDRVDNRFLLRLNRGSGVWFLASVNPKVNGVRNQEGWETTLPLLIITNINIKVKEDLKMSTILKGMIIYFVIAGVTRLVKAFILKYNDKTED